MFKQLLSLKAVTFAHSKNKFKGRYLCFPRNVARSTGERRQFCFRVHSVAAGQVLKLESNVLPVVPDCIGDEDQQEDRVAGPDRHQPGLPVPLQPLGKVFHLQPGDLLAIQLGDEQSCCDHQQDGVTGLQLTELIRTYFYSF